MPNSNSDELDDKIREALSDEDRALMAHFEEQGLFGQLGSLFQGKLAWLSMITFVVGLLMFAIGVYAAWKFATVGEVISMLKWGAIAWSGIMSMIMIKLWSWMRMETNRTLREIKRLELQIVRMQGI
ncbi:MAG: hypothetical protein L3J65_05565 [Robiginitomaculum sp.]|nr:hypothetical protein [Robiginitomaculum sp.]